MYFMNIYDMHYEYLLGHFHYWHTMSEYVVLMLGNHQYVYIIIQ